ncbi:MAG: hypothetical protein QOD51_222 [Candidatus Eremiobacteraeota bacterium]|nr:hypothetical protein [Candidatus Eremiobacteraeota bacterium]
MLAAKLAAAGYDVELSIGVLGAAASDESVLAHAMQTQRALLTMNCDDFVDLVSDGRAHPGLLLHYRGGGGLTYDQIVTALDNVRSAFESIAGQVISLKQWAWKPAGVSAPGGGGS